MVEEVVKGKVEDLMQSWEWTPDADGVCVRDQLHFGVVVDCGVKGWEQMSVDVFLNTYDFELSVLRLQSSLSRTIHQTLLLFLSG